MTTKVSQRSPQQRSRLPETLPKGKQGGILTPCNTAFQILQEIRSFPDVTRIIENNSCITVKEKCSGSRTLTGIDLKMSHMRKNSLISSWKALSNVGAGMALLPTALTNILTAVYKKNHDYQGDGKKCLITFNMLP